MQEKPTSEKGYKRSKAIQMRSCKEAEQMMNDNIGIMWNVINKKFPRYLNDGEVLNSAMYGLYKAALHFDEAKGFQFSTFAYRYVTNEVYLALRMKRDGNAEHTISLNKSYGDDNCPELVDILADEAPLPDENAGGIALVEWIKKWLEDKPERFAVTVAMTAQGYTQKDIAERLGVSRQRVSQILKRVRRELSKWETTDPYKSE